MRVRDLRLPHRRPRGLRRPCGREPRRCARPAGPLVATPLLLLAAALCGTAHAHVVAGTKSLLQLVREADLVATARIVATEVAAGAEGAQRPAVEAEILDVLKGAAPGGGTSGTRVRFAQHGHGVAEFEPGEGTLLFLLDVARSRELDAIAGAGAVSHVSLQEHADEYPLRGPAHEVLLEAVRRYVRAEAETAPGPRVALLRDATLALLTSGDTRLAASALRDLVMAPTLPLLRKQELPQLLAVVDDPGVSTGMRAGLLAELERRRLVEGPPRWAQLVESAAPEDRVAAIRAAGAHPSAPVQGVLVARLSDPDEEVAAAAALALGAPGHGEAAPALAQALSGSSWRVRMAAIRGLGRLGSAGLPALRDAAEQHPDPATRRRAAAELRVREAHPTR